MSDYFFSLEFACDSGLYEIQQIEPNLDPELYLTEREYFDYQLEAIANEENQ